MLTTKEREFFSLARALAAAGDGGLGGSLEAEILREATERAGKTYSPSSFVLPWELLTRDMTAAGSSGSENLVSSEAQAAKDVLREASLIARLGAEVINATGNVTVPVVTDEVSAEWLAGENDGMTATQPTVGQATMTPRLAASLVTLSHQMTRQAPNADALIARHITRSVGRLLDAAVLNGTGTAGAPQGIAVTTGVNSITGAAFDLAAALGAVEDVRDAGTEPTAWVMPPAVATLLGQREGVADNSMLIENGRMAGVPAVASDAAPAATISLADWSQLAIALWGGGVQISTDPFSAFNTGAVSVRALLLCDVALMHRAAFCYGSSVS